MRHILVELDESEFEELSKLKGRKTWKQFVLDLARGAKIEVPCSQSNISIDIDKIVRAVERRVQDSVNPFTAKIDDLARRVGEIESAIGLVVERLGNIERFLKESSSICSTDGEKTVKREKGMSAIDYLKRDKITYESDLARKKGFDKQDARDAIFSKLERAGAIVVPLKSERVAIDPDFFRSFIEKIRSLNTSNEEEIKKSLSKKEYKLFTKLVESAHIWFDTSENRWKISEELESRLGHGEEPHEEPFEDIYIEETDSVSSGSEQN